MKTELKHIFGECRAIKDDVEETRTIEFVISTDKRDRHGTRLIVDRWELENFNKNGIVGYQHNVYGSWFSDPNPDDVIGVGKAWKEDGQLIGSIKFEPGDINPLAEKIFRKILHGTLKSTSVGFRETVEGEEIKEQDGTKTYVYGGQELLEISVVNIPSNTDAVKREATAEQKHFIKDVIREYQKEQESERFTETDTTIDELDHLKVKMKLTLNKNKLALSQA